MGQGQPLTGQNLQAIWCLLGTASLNPVAATVDITTLLSNCSLEDCVVEQTRRTICQQTGLQHNDMEKSCKQGFYRKDIQDTLVS